MESAIEEIFDKALAMGGTLLENTAPALPRHPFWKKKRALSSIVFSRRLRKAMDPHGILNPGKITGVE